MVTELESGGVLVAFQSFNRIGLKLQNGFYHS